MQITKTRKKRLLIIAVIIVAVALSLAGFLYWRSQAPPTSDYKPKYQLSSESDNKISEKTNPDDKSSSSNSSSNTGLSQTSEEVAVSPSGSVSIVDLSQESGFVNVLARTSGFSPIKCVYQFESEGARPVIRETNPSCNGISIPQVEFEKIGTYNLTVTVYDSSSKISTSKDVDIR